jgi:hypothetical protein
VTDEDARMAKIVANLVEPMSNDDEMLRSDDEYVNKKTSLTRGLEPSQS